MRSFISPQNIIRLRYELVVLFGLYFLGIGALSANCATARSLPVTSYDGKLQNQDAVNIFRASTTLIQGNKCNVSLMLAGPVSALGMPRTIEFASDFNEACSHPGVHVVLAIHYCVTSGGDFLGCSTTPGNCMIVVQDTSGMERVLWAHEYGHTRGLRHRDDQNALMSPYIDDTTTTRINPAECRAFMQTTVFAMLQPPHTVAQAARNKAGTRNVSLPNVLDFVRRRYVEGVPFNIASRYGHADAEKLVSFLRDHSSDDEHALPNAVVTLGMIGDPVAVVPLREFIHNGRGPLSSYMVRAKTSALIALGYILNRSKDTEANEKALAILAHGLEPNSWNTVAWRLPNETDPEQRSLMFVRSSILGLALAGTPEAATVLSSAQFKATFAGQPDINKSVSRAIDEAIQVNKTIQNEGLQKYYGEKQRE